ncbi:hypothetical protein [Paenibacillus sp. FSL R7-0179]|uniref:hypothetical protein n=1 Tax=Paenibacillus sp. FSL R7-0179 TaxID=2921672 RepID=UPI0030F6C882
MEYFKRKWSIIIICLIILVSLFFVMERSTSIHNTLPNNPSTQIINNLTSYLEAIKNKDAVAATSYLIDEAIPDKDRLIKFYSESITTDKLLAYTVSPNIHIDENGDAQVEATLTLDPGGTVAHTFTLRKVEEKWWVFVAR